MNKTTVLWYPYIFIAVIMHYHWESPDYFQVVERGAVFPLYFPQIFFIFLVYFALFYNFFFGPCGPML